jgi:hypothetical protein
MALQFAPGLVRAFVPVDRIDTYILLRGDRPIYVGRSDHCVRRQLLNHPPLGTANHLLWQPTPSRFAAFALEAYWFHRLDGYGGRLNEILRPDRCNPAAIPPVWSRGISCASTSSEQNAPSWRTVDRPHRISLAAGPPHTPTYEGNLP